MKKLLSLVLLSIVFAAPAFAYGPRIKSSSRETIVCPFTASNGVQGEFKFLVIKDVFMNDGHGVTIFGQSTLPFQSSLNGVSSQSLVGLVGSVNLGSTFDDGTNAKMGLARGSDAAFPAASFDRALSNTLGNLKQTSATVSLSNDGSSSSVYGLVEFDSQSRLPQLHVKFRIIEELSPSTWRDAETVDVQATCNF